MNTTTCFHCGNDFPDRDTVPLPVEGELCGNCMATVREAAPVILAALKALSNAVAPTREGKRDGGTFGNLSLADDVARAAIAKAEAQS